MNALFLYHVSSYNPIISLCIRICKVLERTVDELFRLD